MNKLLKIFDRFWAWRLGNNEADLDNARIEPVDVIERGSKETWIIFIPGTAYHVPISRKRFTPRKGNVIIYALPRSILSPDAIRLKKMFMSFYKNALRTVRERKIKKENLKILSSSMGSIPAFMLANTRGCKRFVTVAPVCDLPREIEESLATRMMLIRAKDYGYSKKRIKEEFKEISPKYNHENMDGEIEISVGEYDYIAPSKAMQNLARKMKKEGKNVKLSVHPHFGHVLLIWLFKIKE